MCFVIRHCELGPEILMSRHDYNGSGANMTTQWLWYPLRSRNCYLTHSLRGENVSSWPWVLDMDAFGHHTLWAGSWDPHAIARVAELQSVQSVTPLLFVRLSTRQLLWLNCRIIGDCDCELRAAVIIVRANLCATYNMWAILWQATAESWWV